MDNPTARDPYRGAPLPPPRSEFMSDNQAGNIWRLAWLAGYRGENKQFGARSALTQRAWVAGYEAGAATACEADPIDEHRHGPIVAKQMAVARYKSTQRARAGLNSAPAPVLRQQQRRFGDMWARGENAAKLGARRVFHAARTSDELRAWEQGYDSEMRKRR